jgi:hypothetical protein
MMMGTRERMRQALDLAGDDRPKTTGIEFAAAAATGKTVTRMFRNLCSGKKGGGGGRGGVFLYTCTSHCCVVSAFLASVIWQVFVSGLGLDFLF